MYCLVLFYHSFMVELKAINPMKKLITVKAVVFFSFYQEVAITGAVFLGWINATQNPSAENGCFSKDDVAKGFQDFLITMEMFVAAIAHHYFFSAERFRTMSGSEGSIKTPFMKAFLSSSLPGDVIQDGIDELLIPVAEGLKLKRKSKNSMSPRNSGMSGGMSETSSGSKGNGELKEGVDVLVEDL